MLGTDRSKIADIAAGLAGLSFSRGDETEADEFSVKYMCPTTYKADGAAIFFEKIVAAGGGGTPEFLSTHPAPENRVANIKARATEMGCTGTVTTGQYADFKASLP